MLLRCDFSALKIYFISHSKDYFPPNDPPLRPNPPERTDGLDGLVALLVLAVRPNPPLLIVFDGFRVWKLLCDTVGFFKGALMLEADLPALGEIDLPLTELPDADFMVDDLFASAVLERYDWGGTVECCEYPPG